MATTVEKEKKKPIVYKCEVKYIDPVHCDSKVGYKITGDVYCLEGEVFLSDCTRGITWNFSIEPHSIEKIDCALAVLTDFRKELIEAQKRYRTDFPPREKKNTELE